MIEACHPIFSVVFELFCGQAQAGGPINLAAAEIHATFDQASTLAALMKGLGALSLRKEDHDNREKCRASPNGLPIDRRDSA
jgi:hypothetical protein